MQPASSLPSKEEQCLPYPQAVSCAWVLVLDTICHLSAPPYFHLLEPELLKPPVQLLTLGTSHPARGDVIFRDAPLPAL